MGIVFKNNAKTTLASNLSSSATSATVTDGSVFPSLNAGEFFLITFDDGANNEICKCTARSGNTLTIVRAQESTTARAFSSGDAAEGRVTAGVLETIQENIAAKSANQTVYNTTTASSATDYDIGIDPSVEANAMVFLNGVMQHHDTFSFSGSTLSFDTAPPNGMALEVIVDNLINLQSSNLTVDTFTAADVGGNPQTDFTLSDAPAAEDNLLVFIDGVFQDQDAYTISNQTLTITDGVTADFGVTVYVINPVNIGTPSDGTVTSSKLSGNITMPADLTVTGDVAFDSPTFVVDNANSRVGIGTASPSTLLDIVGDVKMSANLTVDTDTLHVDATNNRVGIGTTNSSEALTVVGTIRVQSADGDTDGLHISSDSGGDALINAGYSVSDLKFATNDIERLRINSSGNVGINNNNPDHLFDVHGHANSIIASLDHTGFDSRQVGLPGRFMVGPKSSGYPWAGYNFSHVGNNLTYMAGDYAWAISYGNLNRLSFNFAPVGSAGASLTWSERAHIDTDGHFNVGASNPGGRLFNVSAGGSRDIASFTDDNVGLVIQAKSDGSDFTEIVSYRDQDSSYDKLGLRGATYGIVIDASNGNVGVGGELSPAHALEVEEGTNYKGVHIRGSNAPCFTMAQGTSSTASWRMGISGNDGNDFAISSGASTNDKLRIDPDGNFVIGNVNNVTPKTGVHNTTSIAMFPGPILSGRSQGSYQSSYLIARDWFVYAGPPTNSGSYVHMKTSLWGGGSPSGNTSYTMSCFRYHSAYAYGGGVASGMTGFHNWSGTLYNLSSHNDTSWSLVQSPYVSTDGYVVLVAYLSQSYASFSIDWHQWAGYTYREAKVTNVGQHSAATGLY